MGEKVYTGFWINWEDGKFNGATLTIPNYQGLVLLSFLTLYVQFSGACFWRVLCFILHQFRSTTTARDGLFHQQQAILRNAITAPNAMWNLTRSALAWRGKVQSPILNSLPLLLITTVHIAFFAAAGLFSSQVTNTVHGQALVKEGVCGFPIEISNPRNAESSDMSEEELEIFNTEVLLGRLTLSKSASYVRTCYNDDTNSATAVCNLYLQPHLVGINSSAVYNASCPCYPSGEDLGINYPDGDSLTMRKVTQCAPIRADEKYATDWRGPVPEALAGLSNTTIRYYEFGKGDTGCEATRNTSHTNTTTFCVTQYMKDNYLNAYNTESNTAYYLNDTASDFDPIADFSIPHADTTLIAIFSRTKYTGNTSDPLYLAENKTRIHLEFYSSTHDLNVMGCTEQYQFCNFNTGACSPLTGLYGIKESKEKGELQLNTKQEAVYQLMWKSAWAMGMQWSFEVLASEILLARNWVFTSKSLTSSPLPSTLWEDEAYNLHNLSLAIFQRRINEYASPENFEIKPGVHSKDQIVRPTDPEMLALCRSQKIRSSEYYNVSVLGMCVILIVGGLLILLDWTLIQQIFWIRAHTHHRMAKKIDWASTGTLELFRQALEARRIGPWDAGDYLFPTLHEKGKTFTGLGPRQDEQIPLAPLHSNSNIWNLGTAYDGGKYSALPHQRSGSDVETETQGLGDDKKIGETK